MITTIYTVPYDNTLLARAGLPWMTVGPRPMKVETRTELTSVHMFSLCACLDP